MKKIKKLNNKGVTLIELLVGVAILGIIITPFLGAFLISTRTNARSKQMNMATTAAENVMEKIRGLKLKDEIVERLGEKTGESLADGFSTGGPVMILADTSSAIYKWNEKAGEFLNTSTTPDSPAKIIKFIDKQEVNGRTYVAEVTLDSTFNPADTDGNVTTESAIDEYTDYNNESFTSIYSMDSSKDCSFLQTSNMDNAALELFSVYPRDDVKQHMTRKIVVTLGGSNPDKVNAKDVSVQIEYTYNGMTKTLFADAKHISGRIKDSVRNVYIYYTPYTPDDKYIPINGGETIEIVNKKHNDGERVEDVSVYIVCQNSEKQGNKINYSTYKSASPTISLIEDESASSYSGQVATQIRVGNSLFVDGDKKPIEKVYNYLIDGKSQIGSENTPAATAMGIVGLAAESVSDKAYDVTVRVYPIEDYSVSFYNEFLEGTNEEDHISKAVNTITGSKERQ